MSAYEVRPERMEPLWDRVDRNRWQLLAVVSLFIVTMTVLFTALSFAAAVVALAIAAVVSNAGIARLAEAPLGALLVWLAVACLAGVVIYAVRTLTRSERWFAERLGATLTRTGEHLEAKSVLKDMAIAVGMDVAPALYLIETPNVNAFVYGRPGRRPLVGVTRGLIERLDRAEQRAVFANLMARLKSGDTMWASVLTALMAPLWRVRTLQMTAADDELTRPSKDISTEVGVAIRVSGAPGQAVSAVAVPVIVLSGLFIVLSEFLAYGHMRTQLRHAEAADAEGMLLLKDPRSMLATLEKVVRYNNYVPAVGPGMMQLFYAWSSDFSTDDAQDPSNARIARLREVLGVAGMPPAPVPDEPVFEFVPPAPRLGDAALLPDTHDPITISAPAWWVGMLCAVIGSLKAVADYNATVSALWPGGMAFAGAEWVAFSSQVATAQLRMLWLAVAWVFLGSLITGRTWAGLLGGVSAFVWIAASVYLRLDQPGMDPDRFLGRVLIAMLVASVSGGLIGGFIGRRLARRSG